MALFNLVFLFVFLLSATGDEGGSSGGGGPCEHSSLTLTLHDLVHQHSSIASLHSIGNSSEGRPLWVMVLGERVDLRPRLRPMVKLVGNLNGYSGPACFTLLSLAKRLLEGYRQGGGGNSAERRLLQSLELHILFDMNPDGFAKSSPGSCTDGFGRWSSVNLNRDFPHIFPTEEDAADLDPSGLSDPPHPFTHKHQPETEAVMRWSLDNNFLLSLSLLAGHSLVVIPFDDEMGLGVTGPHAHPTPDDDIFQSLALKYASFVWGQSGGSGMPWNCPKLGRNFPRGWVNGAEWYPARGTMMDWSYVRAGTPELTIGLSCCRNPPPESPTMLHITENHREALFSLLVDVARGGVRGQVVDSFTGEVLDGAMLSRVGPLSLPWFTSPQGEFWRLLPQGKHNLEVSREGYRSTRVEVEVGGFEHEEDMPTIVTIHLRPLHPPTTTTTTKPTPTPTSPLPSVSTSPTTTLRAEESSSDPLFITPPSTDNTSLVTNTNARVGMDKVTKKMGGDRDTWLSGFHRGLRVMLAYPSSCVTPKPPHLLLLIFNVFSLFLFIIILISSI